MTNRAQGGPSNGAAAGKICQFKLVLLGESAVGKWTTVAACRTINEPHVYTWTLQPMPTLRGLVFDETKKNELKEISNHWIAEDNRRFSWFHPQVNRP